MIAATLPENVQSRESTVTPPNILKSQSYARDILLVWNWHTSQGNKLDPRRYNLLQFNDWVNAESDLISALGKVLPIWNVAYILEDLGDYERAKRVFQRAVSSYALAIGDEDSGTQDVKVGLTILSWASGKGHQAL